VSRKSLRALSKKGTRWLTFGTEWSLIGITNETNVGITTEVDILSCHPFAHTAQKLKKKTFLDRLVSVNGRRGAFFQPRVDMVRVDHSVQLFVFLLSQRSDECRRIGCFVMDSRFARLEGKSMNYSIVITTKNPPGYQHQ
jgi:hypothetical protein